LPKKGRRLSFSAENACYRNPEPAAVAPQTGWSR
jgi:hypothetical protein